jgi:ABC-type uncharacterized transport system substrate-binding protein
MYRSRLPAVLFAALVATAGAQPAAAHPHVWVSVRTTVLYENGTIVGLRHAWTFDEYYSIMAIEGLDKDKDGKFTRDELSELAKINVDALKEFGYFTFPRLKDQDLEVTAPTDYWLEHGPRVVPPSETPPPPDSATLPRRPAQQATGTDSAAGTAPAGDALSGADRIASDARKPSTALTLNFTLPLAKPVLADADGFGFTVGDSSFFIAFEAAPGPSVTLGSGAPANCRVATPEQKADEANPSRPGDLMASQPSDLSINLVAAPSWKVVCTPAG